MNNIIFDTINKLYKNHNSNKSIYCTIETDKAIYKGKLCYDDNHKYDVIILKNGYIFIDNNECKFDKVIINFSNVVSFSYFIDDKYQLV